ncbi:MAG TPA: hypothetical protein VHK01_17340 [Lacipirellulaceae bacterium]|nr:hypothetical protein [Lacipirellulaceae bacterium]
MRKQPKMDFGQQQRDHDFSTEIPREWLDEFEAAARRPLEQRFRYAFIKTYKPVMDDAPFRAFDTTADYRRWCEENLPGWLGYGRD